MLFGFLDWISLFSAITGTKRVQNVNYILAKMAFPYAAHDWQIPMWPQESHVESMTESTNSQESTLRKVRQLRGEIRQVETASRNDDGSLIPSGSTAMDRLLPAGGYNRGTIVEWLADRGSSVDYLSLLGARNASADGGGVVIVDGQGDFYPPAARAMGIRLNNLVVLRSNEKGPRQWMAPGQSQALDQDDLCWAIDQSLRCNAVAAVWGALPDFESLHAERTWLRRFQLSAETSGCTGFFVRPTRLTNSSWAEVQWKVEPLSSTRECRRVQVTLARCQGGIAGQTIDLEINTSTGIVQEDETRKRESRKRKSRGEPARSLPLAAKLAHPTPRRRSARA